MMLTIQEEKTSTALKQSIRRSFGKDQQNEETQTSQIQEFTQEL